MTGIDIISIERFRNINSKEYSYWSKIFSASEWQYAFSRADSGATLAGIYAAKEAVMKAVGGDLLKRADRIIVGHLSDGRPTVIIDKQEQPSINVSISHDAGVAVAVAVQYER